MPKFNDINLDDWKNCDVETDSLWLINNRDNSGKHDGFYHGNFIPQVPRQLIKRYTKKGETVFDAFCGSGTTAFECENLERNFIGVEIQKNLVDLVNSKLDNGNRVICGDSANKNIYKDIKAQLVILHPPYFNIIKFSDNKEDLSAINNLQGFRDKFKNVIQNSVEVLEYNRYLAIVVGDKYENGEWIPLGFYLMQDAMNCGLKLKSIVIKNMSGNRAKRDKETIWRYRALSSDYYIFKHEYIYVFKKEKTNDKERIVY
jgi:DNA modification methylase